MQQLAGEGRPQGTLHVPCDSMKAWYDAIITRLIPAIKCPLERAKSNGAAVEYLVVTGGMASSPYLTAKLKEAFGPHVRDICYPSVLYQTVLTGETSAVECHALGLSRPAVYVPSRNWKESLFGYMLVGICFSCISLRFCLCFFLMYELAPVLKFASS